MEFYNAYSGGQRELYTSEALFEYLGGKPVRAIINDAAAQTIAAWWHSPASPLSTRLSTGGHVDVALTITDFATAAQRADASPEDQRALTELETYITYHQLIAASGAWTCACAGCFDAVYGQVGAVCSECKESGCDNQGSPCERPRDEYGPGHDTGNHAQCITERGVCD